MDTLWGRLAVTGVLACVPMIIAWSLGAPGWAIFSLGFLMWHIWQVLAKISDVAKMVQDVYDKVGK